VKSRILIPLLLLLLVVVIGGYFAGTKFFHIDQKTRDYLIEKVSALLGGEVDASSVSILPWSISIKDARLRLKDSPIKVEIKRIRIRFNLIKFVRNRFKPVYGTEQIFLDRPEFMWIITEKKDADAPINLNDFPVLSHKNLPFTRININKGLVILRRNDEQLVLAENISGWMDGTPSDVIYLNVEGKLLSEKKNTTCKGVYNRADNSYVLNLISQDCSFTRRNIEILSGNILPAKGFLDYSLRFEQKNGELLINGDFSVEDGAFKLKGYNAGVSGVSINGTVTRKEIIFETITGTVWDVKPELSGRLILDPSPSLVLSLKADDIEISKVLTDIYSGDTIFPSGKININATIDGPPRNLNTSAVLSSEVLTYKNERIRDFNIILKLAEGKVSFEDIRVAYKNLALRGHGESNFVSHAEEKDFTLDLNIRSLSDKTQNYSLDLSGSAIPGKDIYNADFKLRRIYQGDPGYYNCNGILSINRNDLNVKMENDFLTIEGKAENIFEDARVECKINYTLLPLLDYMGYGNKDVLINGTGELRGTSKALSFDADMEVMTDKHLTTRLTGRAFFENILEDYRRLDIDARLHEFRFWYSHPMTFKIYAKADSASVKAKITDDDGLFVSLTAVPETGELSGYLNINDFPLEKIVDITKRESFSHKGRLNGQAKIGGTIENPNLKTPEPVTASNLKIGGLDRLSGSTFVSGNMKELTFSDVKIKRDENPIIVAHGSWVDGKPFILDLEGTAVELSSIGDIISTTRKIDGKVNYDFVMTFTRQSGTIEGGFTVRNGHFLDVPFDEAKGVFGGGSTGFTVTDFTAVKENLYTAKGSALSGYLWKYNNEAPGLKLDIVFQGELLRTLPHLTSAIKEASGQGQLNAELGGTWQDPIILDAELYVTKGTIKPAFLIDEVKDITAILKIDPDLETGSNYKAIRIRLGTGVVEDKKLIVRNIHAGDDGWDALKRPELLNVVNNQVNLDFGVLTGRLEGINNNNHSIELNVPGFMKPKEKGRFELSGDANGEFFVGASENNGTLTPYISGKILAQSGDITYPMIKVASSDSGSDFLSDIYWDIEINAGSSAYYVNEVTRNLGGLINTTVSRIESKFDENSVFKVMGRLSDGSFRVTGDALSTTGVVSYFGAEFDIERVDFDLDTGREGLPAILTGRGRTVVYDSIGVATEIHLNVNTVDNITSRRRPLPGRVDVQDDPLFTYGARRTFEVQGLGTLEIEFTSTNPSDDTEEKILAKLGISSENLGMTAARALTSGFDSYYTRQWLRPFEDAIKKYTKLDVIRVTPSVIGNIMRSRLGYSEPYFHESDYAFFDESRLMLGEYLFQDWFMSYRGQYGLSRNFLNLRERGFFHEIGLQYNLQQNTRLHFKYLYDDVIKEGERRIEIRHDFTF